MDLSISHVRCLKLCRIYWASCPVTNVRTYIVPSVCNTVKEKKCETQQMVKYRGRVPRLVREEICQDIPRQVCHSLTTQYCQERPGPRCEQGGPQLGETSRLQASTDWTVLDVQSLYCRLPTEYDNIFNPEIIVCVFFRDFPHILLTCRGQNFWFLRHFMALTLTVLKQI